METFDWNKYDETAIGIHGYTDSALLEKYAKGKILDVGCGRGKLLASLNGERYGIDLSDRAFKENSGADLRVGSATDIPFPDNTFDFVYSLEVIEHVKDYRLMLSEMKRVVKDDGVIFIQTPNYPTKRIYDIIFWMLGRKATWRDDYTHVSFFSWRKLSKEVGRLFSVESVTTRNILGESYVPFLKKLKRNPIGLTLGQKTIIVARP